MTPSETIHAAESKARHACEDFILNHGLKPNALMAGQAFVQGIVAATQTLAMLGQTKAIEAALPHCPKLGQRLLCGLPLVISSRNDHHVTAVLVGDPTVLISPNQQPAKA